MRSGPLVSVVVPARNAAGTLARTLASVEAQDFDQPFEVIVVDDGSDDETREIALSARGEPTVLAQPPEGPGPARNRGVRNATAPVLAFIDADCFAQPDWLRKGLEAIETADLVQGLVRPDPEARRRPFDRTVGVGRAGGLFECANLFVRRDLFDRLGGFEDWLRARIGKPLAEDIWFGWRARRAGARTAFARDAVVDHAVFHRGPTELVSERVRLVYFPAIVRKVPELREDFLFARCFLTPRSCAFDLGLVGVIVAVVTASPVPLFLAVPYAVSLGRASLRWRLRAPLVALTELAADALGFVALFWGSLRARTVVL